MPLAHRLGHAGLVLARLPEALAAGGEVLGQVLLVGDHREVRPLPPQVGPRGALLLTFLASSTLFGMMHLANGNATVFSMLTTICAGLLFSLPFLLTGELGIPIGFHFTWNLFLSTMYGFALSGAAQGTRLISIQITGPDAWTGGAYGPEVGLISLVWALAGCGSIFLWNKWIRGRVELHLALATYSPSKDSL